MRASQSLYPHVNELYIIIKSCIVFSIQCAIGSLYMNRLFKVDMISALPSSLVFGLGVFLLKKKNCDSTVLLHLCSASMFVFIYRWWFCLQHMIYAAQFDMLVQVCSLVVHDRQLSLSYETSDRAPRQSFDWANKTIQLTFLACQEKYRTSY